ncbi:MAG: hypothetical protein P8Y53_09990, partial [Pseudolabrys sp.]
MFGKRSGTKEAPAPAQAPQQPTSPAASPPLQPGQPAQPAAENHPADTGHAPFPSEGLGAPPGAGAGADAA